MIDEDMVWPNALRNLAREVETLDEMPMTARILKNMADAWAADRAEITRLLELIRQTDAEKRAAEMERDAALEELRLIKQTTRPVPGDLLDEKNQHGEYSMDTLPFDYALYGIAGEPQHDTSGKSCWCGATADGDGVVVHRDMAAVLTAARQLGQDDAQPDYAARSAVEIELRAIAHIYGTAAGLEPLDSISGMLSQISNIIAGVASQRDAANARAARLAKLLQEMYDPTPCRLDHHGRCQEHFLSEAPCVMRRIENELWPHAQPDAGDGEREAKTKSDPGSSPPVGPL